MGVVLSDCVVRIYTVYFRCHSNAKNMPQAVLDALRAVCVQVGGLSEEKAARLLTSMETRRKLQLETWA